MRELVYVSKYKLQQFDVGQRQRRWGGAHVEAEVKIPGIGAVKAGPARTESTSRLARLYRMNTSLSKAITSLDKSDRAPRWFAEPDVLPGQWIHFEAPLGYTTLPGAVIFLDLDHQTASYPTGGSLRLMLHGSRENLIGNRPERSVWRDESRILNLQASTFQRLLGEFSDFLVDPDIAVESNDDRPVSRRLEATHPLPDRFMEIVAMLDARMQQRHTAAWMAGYARITAMIPFEQETRLIVATPLYVEYVTEPLSE